MKKVLFCGDREWDNYDLVLHEMKKYRDCEIVSGGCRGLDKMAEKAAQELNLKIHVFDADWNKYGRAAGPIRNKEMLNFIDKDDLVIAFHNNLDKSKGTKNTVDQARKMNIKVKIVSEND